MVLTSIAGHTRPRFAGSATSAAALTNFGLKRPMIFTSARSTHCAHHGIPISRAIRGVRMPQLNHPLSFAKVYRQFPSVAPNKIRAGLLDQVRIAALFKNSMTSGDPTVVHLISQAKSAVPIRAHVDLVQLASRCLLRIAGQCESAKPVYRQLNDNWSDRQERHSWKVCARFEPPITHDNSNHVSAVSCTSLKPYIFDVALNRAWRDM